MAAYCVSRYNDIDGYWGVGILYKYARERGTFELEIQIPPNGKIAHELSEFRRHFIARFCQEDQYLGHFVLGYIINFKFEPHRGLDRLELNRPTPSSISVREDPALATCEVRILWPAPPKVDMRKVEFCPNKSRTK